MCWLVMYRCQTRGNYTLIRNVLFLSPTDMRSHNPPPWRSSVLVSGSDTIFNRSNPPVADIVCFDMLRIAVSLTIFKTRLLGRGNHTLIRNVSFPSPTDVGSHNPPPWGSASLLIHHPVSGSNIICNNQNP